MMKKKRRGRPSSFKTEYIEQARKIAVLGATDKQVAVFFNVSEATINNWKLENADFLESLKDGKKMADGEVVESLYHRAKGYSHKEDKIFNNNGKPLIVPTTKHYPPDTTACIFWLKNRQKENWRDKTEHGYSGSVIIDVMISARARVESSRRIKVIEADD